MKKVAIISGIVMLILFIAAGHTHLILPKEKDPCQSDMTHEGHLGDLDMFHCIGHSEYEVNYEETGLKRVKKWDHLHEWMTLEWHLEQGFSKEHAEELIAQSKK